MAAPTRLRPLFRDLLAGVLPLVLGAGCSPPPFSWPDVYVIAHPWVCGGKDQVPCGDRFVRLRYNLPRPVPGTKGENDERLTAEVLEGVPDRCRDLCIEAPPSHTECAAESADWYYLYVACYRPLPLGGRRTEGFVESSAVPTQAQNEVGAYFARMAQMEAASVDAFLILWEELFQHGAPPPLLQAALQAAQDERRHARSMQSLALRFGARPAAVEIPRHPPRTLMEIARENAIEGCVRETFAALLAGYQSHAAADPAVRAAMSPIAEEETQHAELAWAVAAWLEAKLGRSARQELHDARAAALAGLRTELEAELSPALLHLAGLPDSEQGRRLLASLSPFLLVSSGQPLA